METAGKRTRGRAKSANADKALSASLDGAENAPNVNGDKDGVSVEGNADKADAYKDKDTKHMDSGLSDEKPTHGRKRKASEMKADDSHAEDANKTKPSDRESGDDADRKSDNEEELSSADVSDNLTMPPKQTLGKGKRARIPNKRYSDIALANASPKGDKKHFENGDSIIKDEESMDVSPTPTTPASKVKESPASSAMKKQKLTDLSNPNFLKPFQFGWKRELVYRATSDSNQKRNGDIYYYTPGGKKVRSMREVSENLSNKELTLDDFTFCKEPLGLDDPEKEIIRDAKLKSAVTPVPKKTAAPKTPKTPKPTSPKLAPGVTSPVADTPKVKASPRVGGFKVKFPSKGEKANKAKAAKKAKEDDDMEMGMYPPNWASPASKKAPGKWNNLGEDNKPCRPCSIRCQGVSGLIPTLQCRLCLCLYHNECVGLQVQPYPSIQGYVCKNCQLDLEQNSGSSASLSSPPPLLQSPAAESSTTDAPTPQTGPLPKLQRMPRPGEQKAQAKPKDVTKPMPKLTPKPGILSTAPKLVKLADSNTIQVPETKGLVGSVTTWFPPTSTIQVGELRSYESGASAVQRPQFVEFVGNKKYLIVPTHNVVAVSPQIAPVANYRPEGGLIESNQSMREPSVEASGATANVPDSASLGPDGSRGDGFRSDGITNDGSDPSRNDGFRSGDSRTDDTGTEGSRTEGLGPDGVSVKVELQDMPAVETKQEPEAMDVNRSFDDLSESYNKESSSKDSYSKESYSKESYNIESHNQDPYSTESHGSETYGESCGADPYETDPYSRGPPPLLPAPIPNLPEPGTRKDLRGGRKDAQQMEVSTTEKVKETPEKKRVSRSSTALKKIDTTRTEEMKFMDSYLQNLSFGYSALLYVFQYLKVQDLLRAGCVCTMWRDLASHPSLWRTVRMKNSQVHSFEGLAKTLNKHGTVHLDLRKMLLPTNNSSNPSSGDDIWPLFSSAIKQVESLRRIELCRCPAAVVEQLAESNPKLQVLNAVTIKCEFMSLDPLKNLKDLQELRLKSTTGLTLSTDLTALRELKQLKHLSLTSIKDLNKLNIEVIAELTNLESLDFGECHNFPMTFGSEILTKLSKLEKLRLEKGQGTCYTFEILEAVKNMPKLEQLELVNFDIKAGFDKALGACTNIKKLLIIPTYISQSATTNHMVLGGVLRLQNTLSHFVWGVTLELLRVTELFVVQCEDPDKKEVKDKKPSAILDSIPVLKPVPLLGETLDSSEVTQDPPQVEILPLPNLQKLLLQNLPTTRVKILKIPFHATWRQSITDTVN